MRSPAGVCTVLACALFVGAALASCTEANGRATSPVPLTNGSFQEATPGGGQAHLAPPAAPADSGAALPVLLPGPAPRPALAPVDGIGAPTQEGCAKCHQEIAAEWSGSLHHQAWQNTYFARAYAVERTAFCRKCHAPGADPAFEPPPEEREIGVGCTTCHVVPQGIVGVRALPAPGGAAASFQAPGHAVLGDARLATPQACASCHEFSFPGPPGQITGPMQATLAEHQRSEARETACQECHMPRVSSARGGLHRSHAFRVQGDKAMLAQAVQVVRAELAPGELRLSLAPGKIGHAFPTGDLFRQVEVRALPLDGAGRVVGGGSSQVLGRTFTATNGVGGTLVGKERSDSRLAGPRSLVLKVPVAARRATWQIVWQRLPPWLAKSFRMDMSDHEMVVLEGTVKR